MEQPASKSATWNDLKIRTLSSAALAFLVLFFLWIGGVAFSFLIILAVIQMIKEWERLTQERRAFIRYAGYAYIIIPASCILWMRSISAVGDPSLGLKIVLTLIAVISATDTGAYFTGRKFGHNKLCPSISPNKTWEGLAGGIAAATIVGTLCSAYITIPHSFVVAVLASPVIAIVAQIGDLFKSWIKRRAGVKDSGSLIPGHGGLLDRFDGYMFTAPLMAVIIYFVLKETL